MAVAQLTIGELSERSGVATSALRYYEAQLVGLTLDDIAEALATLPEGRTPTKADWSRLSRSWRPRIDAQIERLERLREKLDGCIGCGCLSLRTCALNNPDDVVASRGPGAVYLEPGGGARQD